MLLGSRAAELPERSSGRGTGSPVREQVHGSLNRAANDASRESVRL
jgi:hypothetical protein